jgi:hypothetical protein
MAGEFISANDDLEPYVQKLYDLGYHEALRDHEVTIDFLIAYPDYDSQGLPKGPAIKHQGYAARGLCKITNYKDRVKGHGDAEITIDGEWWDDPKTSENQKLALLDHEMSHLVLDHETDQAGRPKLVMRKHDFQVGWFMDVAARWGAASSEVEQAQVLKQPHVEQLLFSFEASAFAKPEPPASLPGVIINGTFGQRGKGKGKGKSGKRKSS